MTLTLPQMDPCYFCQIIQAKADRWNVIAEDDLTITLLNGRQFETGQCMVLPVRHAPTLFDLNHMEAAAVMAAARKVAEMMMQAFDPTGILLYQNNGIGSGQEVPHFHLHVVPRRPGSDWGFGPPHIAAITRDERPGEFDHEIVNDRKLDTVKTLRLRFTLALRKP